MDPILQTALDYADAGFRVHWLKPNSLKPFSKNWGIEGVTKLDLQTSYKPGLQLGLETNCAVGPQDPFDPTPDQQPYLSAVDVIIRRASDEPHALTALETRFPDWARYPRCMHGDGSKSFTVFFFTEVGHKSRPLAGSSQTFMNALGKRVHTWDIMLSPALVPVAPSKAGNGGTFAWGSLSLLDAVKSDVNIDLSNDDVAILLKEHEAAPEVEASDIDDLPTLLGRLPTHAWRDDFLRWREVGQAIAAEFKGGPDEPRAFEAWVKWTNGEHKEDYSELWSRFGYVERAEYEAGLRQLKLDDLYRTVRRVRPRLLTKIVREAQTIELAINAVAQHELSDVQKADAIKLLVDKAASEGVNMKATEIKASLARERKVEKKLERKANPSLAGGLELGLVEDLMQHRFTTEDGTRTLVVVDKNAFMWAGGRWAQTSTDEVAAEVWTHLKSMAQGSPTAGSAESRRMLASMAAESNRIETLNSLSNSVAAGLLKEALVPMHLNPLGMRTATMSTLATINTMNKYLTILPDGTITEQDPHPSHNCFYTLGTSYQPTATCPLWERTLQEIFSGHSVSERIEAIRHFQELFGYVLQSTRPHALFIYMKGHGGAGKSLLAKVLSAVLGPENVDNTPLSELASGQDSHATASLMGKRLLLDEDVDKGVVLPDGFVKKVSEHKQMTANPKGGSKYNFQAMCVLMFLANHWLATKETGYAIQRRAHVFEFNAPKFKKDPMRVHQIIENELPGILNWAIEGYKRLARRGDFDMPISCTNAMQAWFNQRDAVRAFAMESFQKTGKNTDRIERKKVYQMFVNWTMESGNGKSLGRNEFYQRFPEVMGIPAPAETASHFEGILAKTAISSWATVPKETGGIISPDHPNFPPPAPGDIEDVW